MNQQAIQDYITGFGRRFLEADLLDKYFEMKIIPGYLAKNFPNARTVLDLGCGTGLYFWASFLPLLERLDGIDLYKEFISEADRVINLDKVPDGYQMAHEFLGQTFTLDDLHKLKAKRGNLVIADFRKHFPDPIASSRYDLVTEFGSIGEVQTNAEFIDVVKRSAEVLKQGGSMMFVNFLEREIDTPAQALGRFTPDSLELGEPLFHEAVQKSGMIMVDFNSVNQKEGPIKTFFYGFARKQ